MTLENRGIPTVVVCTEPFVNSALAHARMFGRGGLQTAVFPHPLGGLPPDQVSQRADAIIDSIEHVLTNGA